MIEFEHNGYSIRFDERDDKWECYELKVASKSLKAVKAEINKIDADARRLEAVRLIELRSYETRQMTGTLMAGESSVWCMVKGRGNEAPRREKASLANLVLDTPENRAVIAQAQALARQARELGQARADLLAAIPRVTAEELKAITPTPSTVKELPHG